MSLYEIRNPTKAKRVFYDGIAGSQKQIVIPSGGCTREVLADHIAIDIMNTPNDLRLTLIEDAPAAPLVSTPLPQMQQKPICHVIGHRGIGDNIHQRAPIRELMKEHEVYLETPAWMIYHDLIAQGLKLIFLPTNLHAQAKQIQRERNTYQWHHKPANIRSSRRIYYNKADVDRHGSIAQAMFGTCQLPIPERPDFSMPVPEEWRQRARDRIKTWNVGGKPLLVYRPITFRREWNGSTRNPDPAAYHELFKPLRDRFFVVSVAHLVHGAENIVGIEQSADVKLHAGELDFAELAGLWKEADLIYANAGFGPVLAQAVGTPCITIYGGRESYRTTERAGAHLAPTLGIDPDRPCDCHSEAMRCNRCQKHITVAPAIERIANFVADNVKSLPKIDVPVAVTAETVKSTGTLIFGTFYIDSADREQLTDLWVKLHTTLNPGCDFLAVDSQSPIEMFQDWTPYDGKRAERMVFNFPDNIGHLSRAKTTPGRDGWGRAFCKGLEIACELGYEYVVHIEGDSLFRLSVKDAVERMKVNKASCFSTGVHGMRVPGSGVGWVETGLMMFSTEFLKNSKFIDRYNWPNRKVAPTPEVVVRQLLGHDLILQDSWRALRADKNQITKDNIESLNLDWVTHQHDSAQQDVYRKFVEIALTEKPKVVVPAEPASPIINSVVTVPQPRPLNKINLGCGTNRLPGWHNHDADVDITKSLPWNDATASHIFIEHCVEHVGHKQAISFFKEAHRVLAPGGTLRVTVPSLEKIYRCDDPEYHKFTTKFHREGATKRGAMYSIIYCHGHEMIWSPILLEACLYYAGFDQIEHCEPGKSPHKELVGVEGHGRVIGDKFNNIESICVEATKIGILPAGIVHDPNIAILVGGGLRWGEDLQTAKQLCTAHGLTPEYFYCNDHIENFPEGSAVTLHPDKVQAWLVGRRKNGLPAPPEIWAHRQSPKAGVTHWTDDWRGSVGLFMVAVAMRKGHKKILLCGIPMDPAQNHFRRTSQKWLACSAFMPGWKQRFKQIEHHVRSLSGGWTEELLGKPTDEWLTDQERKVA